MEPTTTLPRDLWQKPSLESLLSIPGLQRSSSMLAPKNSTITYEHAQEVPSLSQKMTSLAMPTQPLPQAWTQLANDGEAKKSPLVTAVAELLLLEPSSPICLSPASLSFDALWLSRLSSLDSTLSDPDQLSSPKCSPVPSWQQPVRSTSQSLDEDFFGLESSLESSLSSRDCSLFDAVSGAPPEHQYLATDTPDSCQQAVDPNLFLSLQLPTDDGFATMSCAGQLAPLDIPEMGAPSQPQDLTTTTTTTRPRAKSGASTCTSSTGDSMPASCTTAPRRSKRAHPQARWSDSSLDSDLAPSPASPAGSLLRMDVQEEGDSQAEDDDGEGEGAVQRRTLGRRKVSELSATELQVVRAKNRILAQRNRIKVRAAQDSLKRKMADLGSTNAALQRQAHDYRAALAQLRQQALRRGDVCAALGLQSPQRRAATSS